MRARDADGVREAVRALFRALGTLRTYPVNNAMSVRALEALEPRLAQVLPLDLQIRADQVLWEGHPVVDAEEDRSSIARALFRDGVRRVMVREGMQRPELDRFVIGLATPLDPENLSEDYVTRLWEAELEHVRIAAVDPYLDLELPDDVLEGKERPGAEAEDPGRQPESESALPPAPLEAFELSEAQHEEMQERVERATQSPRWECFVETVLSVFARPTGERRVDELVLIVESTFQRLLSEQRLELAERMLRWLRGEAPAPAREPLERALARMADPERMRPLHRGLEDGSLEPEAVQRLLLAMGPLGPRTACAFLREAGTRQSQRFYCDVLKRIGAPAGPVVLEEFARGDRDLNRVLARVLGQLREKQAVKPLVAALEGDDSPARREWVRALAMIGGEQALAPLLPVALGDADSTCRVLALRGLRGERSSLGHRQILKRVRSSAFAPLGDEEKDLLFEAVGATGTDEALPVLERMIKPSWIPGRTRPDDQRRAVRALVRLATPAAQELLERYAGSRRRGLAELCEAALEELREVAA